MSKPIDKKSTLVLNSAGPNAKDVSKGNISYILPRESPNQDEAHVSLEIKDIRFGQKSVTNPEITAIINGSKKVCKVPFEEPLNYNFKKIEDDMVFKFAVTSSGDLLGFIYMEVPHKFKAMKSFRLDDWFPIKHLETEEHENIKSENFVAKIVVNYKGTRKLDAAQQFTGKLPKAQLYEEMAKNLKQRIADINQAVDQFSEEGFKHLAVFERKLIKKKINANSADSDPKKTLGATTGQPTRYINVQKDHFYKTRNVMGETQEIKNAEANPGNFYQVDSKPQKPGVSTNGKNCVQCEKLLKELAYSRNELIEATQRLNSLEEGLMTVDNVQLKRRMEKELDELAKDKKEFNLKLRDSNEQLSKDRQRLSNEFQAEKEKALKQQEEYAGLAQEYKALVSSAKTDEDRLAREREQFGKKAAELEERERKLAESQGKLKREKQALEEKSDEMKEIKVRMMQERQRILEEGGKYAYFKGDVDLKEKQLKTVEEFLTEEKEEFRREMDKKNREIEALQAELAQKKELYDLELHHLNQDKTDLQRRNNELVEERKKLKIEGVRLWQDKNKTAHDVEEFLQEKHALDEHKQTQRDELDKDYAYIDEQLALIERQKHEFDDLNTKLGNYEKYILEQNRIQADQRDRFLILQRNFFEKLNKSDFDVEELKRQAAAFDAEFGKADRKFRDNQKVIKDLDKSKEEFKKNIHNIIEQQGKEGTVNDRRNTNIERRHSKTREGSFTSQVPDALKIKKEAFDLVEDIFANVLLRRASKNDLKQNSLIDELSGKVQALEDQLRNETAKFKQYKLTSFSGGERRPSENSRVVQNPFHGMDAQSPSNNTPKGSLSGPANHQPPDDIGGLKELQNDMLDLCDGAIETLQKQPENGKNSAAVQEERVKYLQNSKKMVNNLFKALTQIQSGKLDPKGEAVKAFNLDHDQLDFEIIKQKYEHKIQKLLEYIQQIRDNTDFFNNNIDNEILAK